MIGLLLAALLQRAPLPLPYVAPLIEPVPPEISSHLVTFHCSATDFSLTYGRADGVITLGPITRQTGSRPTVEVRGGGREDLKQWASQLQQIEQVTPACVGTGAVIYVHAFKQERRILYELWINDQGAMMKRDGLIGP